MPFPFKFMKMRHYRCAGVLLYRASLLEAKLQKRTVTLGPEDPITHHREILDGVSEEGDLSIRVSSGTIRCFRLHDKVSGHEVDRLQRIAEVELLS